jgi:hypothetical protein
MAIDPFPKLKLQYLHIMANPERKMMEITIEHYKLALPNFINEFEEYFAEIKLLTPAERCLVVLQLIHLKNQLSHEKLPAQMKNL